MPALLIHCVQRGDALGGVGEVGGELVGFVVMSGSSDDERDGAGDDLADAQDPTADAVNRCVGCRPVGDDRNSAAVCGGVTEGCECCIGGVESGMPFGCEISDFGHDLGCRAMKSPSLG